MHPPMHMYTYMNIYTYPTHTRHTHKDRHKPVCALLGAGDTIKKNKELPVRENGDLNKIRGSRV